MNQNDNNQIKLPIVTHRYIQGIHKRMVQFQT
jgi:hypothetical protein